MTHSARVTVAGKYQLAAALFFLAALLLLRPNVEAGMNDDWSFIRTTQDLAATGHLRYNGWSAPLIGFQAYWGALFIKVFGFSFTVVRVSVWVLTILFIPILWRILQSVGLSERQSFFGLLMFLFSPLILPNLTTFMTDVPAFFLCAAALLSAIKAWNSERDRTAMLWIGATTVFGLLSGSVRQIYWLSGICFLLVLAFTRMRSLRGRLLIGICIVLTMVLAAAASHWLAQQPYVPADTTWNDLRDLSWTEMIQQPSVELSRDLLGLAVVCIPFSLLLVHDEARRLPAWVQCLIILTALAIAFAYQIGWPLPWRGNTISQYGVLSNHTVSAGDKRQILSKPVVVLLGTAGLASASYVICAFVRLRKAFDAGLGRFALLTVPFLLAYVAVLAYRATAFGLFDRYLIPLLFVAATFTLGIYAKRHGDIGFAGWSAGGLFALYALAATHDYFAEAKAKLEATEQILRAGHTRDTIMSGFEFDSWTQVEINGHLNNDQLDSPPDAYRETDDCNGPDDTQMWWRPQTPDLKARYVVSITPLGDLQAAEFAPVAYSRWLPPTVDHVYVQRINLAEPPLTCKPKN